MTAPFTTLRLTALDRTDATTLLESLLGDEAELDPLKQLIIDTTQGNAFFMQEYVQTLFDKGVLERADSRPGANGGGPVALLRGELSSIEMPPTVQGVLAARIDRLEPTTKAFLQMLSVLGASSPFRVIELMARAPAFELRPVLSTLINADFIYEEPAFPDVDYVFKHTLIRETAYGGLLGDARRELHTRAAQAIEQQFRDRIDDHCSELAHHYALSDNPAKAVEFLRQAGLQAIQRSAYPAAVEHLQRALSLLAGIDDAVERDEEELQLQSMLGSALSATRGFAVSEVEDAYARARALCDDATGSADFVRVLAGLGLLYINRGQLDLAEEVGKEILALAAQRDDRLLVVTGHEMLGLANLRSGALRSSLNHMSAAVNAYAGRIRDDLVGAVGRDPAMSCLGFGSLALWLLGYPKQALSQVAKALALGESTVPEQPFSRGYALLSSVWLCQFRGESEIGLREAKAAVDFAADHGFPVWSAHTLVLQGWGEVMEGDRALGLAKVEEALAMYDQTGAVVWRPLFMLLYATCLVEDGRPDEALAVVDEGLDIAGIDGRLLVARRPAAVAGRVAGRDGVGRFRCCRALLPPSNRSRIRSGSEVPGAPRLDEFEPISVGPRHHRGRRWA